MCKCANIVTDVPRGKSYFIWDDGVGGANPPLGATTPGSSVVRARYTLLNLVVTAH